MRASEGCSPPPVFLQLENRMWQFHPYTSNPLRKNLLVSHVFSATEKTTTDPTSTTTDGLSVSGDKERSGSRPLTLEAIVGVALAGAVLIIAILGLIIYLRWRRSKGKWSKTSLSLQFSQPEVSLNQPASEWTQEPVKIAKSYWGEVWTSSDINILLKRCLWVITFENHHSRQTPIYKFDHFSWFLT